MKDVNDSKLTLTRRDFLKWSAGTAVAAGVLKRPLPDVVGDGSSLPDWDRGIEAVVPSACLLCPAGCGIRVRTVDQRAIGIEGNPLHPITRGGICAKGLSGLHALYSPERIQTPLKKVGGRDSEQWQAISWDEAIQDVSQHLADLRKAGIAERLVVLDGRPFGLMGQLIQRFAQSYGTPNHIEDFYGDGMPAVIYAAQGIRGLPAYDFAHSNYVLSFGASLMDAGWSPTGFARQYGEFRQGKRERRGRLVQVDTRLSVTAAKADQWIAIRPGTYGALALGLAYVILKEELYDQDFVAENTAGMDLWKDVVMEEGRPEQASAVTGIPIDVILNVAREFASARPSVAVGGYEASSGTAGFYAGLGIYALNALVGSIDAPGGIRFEVPPAYPKEELKPDDLAQKSLAKPQLGRANAVGTLAECHPFSVWKEISGGVPYPIDALLLYYSNPVHSHPNPAATREALKKIPFIVSFSPFLDETTEMADYVLPDLTYLERWQDAPHPSLAGGPAVSIAQPVVKPVFENRHTGEALMAIAQAVGGPAAVALPWKTYEEYLKWGFTSVFDSHAGTPFVTQLELDEVRRLEEAGFSRPAADTFEDFWSAVVKAGGWVDPGYSYHEWTRIFQTPARKFEFVSGTLRAAYESTFADAAKKTGETVEAARRRLLGEWGLAAKDDRLYMPHDESPPAPPDSSLTLTLYKPYTLSTGSLCNLPYLYEILGFLVYSQWEGWLEIHPDDAARLHLEDKEEVFLRVQDRRWKTRVRVYRGAAPGVVNAPFGFGHTAYSAFAQGVGSNAFELVRDIVSPLNGLPDLRVAGVQIEKGG